MLGDRSPVNHLTLTMWNYRELARKKASIENDKCNYGMATCRLKKLKKRSFNYRKTIDSFSFSTSKFLNFTENTISFQLAFLDISKFRQWDKSKSTQLNKLFNLLNRKNTVPVVIRDNSLGIISLRSLQPRLFNDSLS